MKNLISITDYQVTDSIIEVHFTKGQAKRKAILERQGYEDWIQRNDKNILDYLNKWVCVLMGDYWNLPFTKEIAKAFHEEHLICFLILNNLHEDETLKQWVGKVYSEKSIYNTNLQRN